MKLSAGKIRISNARPLDFHNRKISRNKSRNKPFNGDIYYTHQFNPLAKLQSITNVIAGNYQNAFESSLYESNFITCGDLVAHASNVNTTPSDYYFKALKDESSIIRSVAYQRLSTLDIHEILINNDKSGKLINSAITNAELSIKCYPFNLMAYITLGTISFITGNYSNVLKCVKLFKCFNKWDKLHQPPSYTLYKTHNKTTRYNAHISMHAEILSLQAKAFLALKTPVKALYSSIRLYNLLSNIQISIDNIKKKYKITTPFRCLKTIFSHNSNLKDCHRLMYLKIESLIIASSSLFDLENEIFSSIKLNENITVNEVKNVDRTEFESEIRLFLETNKNTLQPSTTSWSHNITKQYIDFIINELIKADFNELKPDTLAWSSVLLYASNRFTQAAVCAIKALVLDVYSAASKQKLFGNEKSRVNAVDIVALVFKRKNNPNWKIFALLSNLNKL